MFHVSASFPLPSVVPFFLVLFRNTIFLATQPDRQDEEASVRCFTARTWMRVFDIVSDWSSTSVTSTSFASQEEPQENHSLLMLNQRVSYTIYIINRLMSLQFFAHDLDFKDFQSLFITFCRCLAVSGVRPQEDIRPSLACRPLSTP